MSTDARWQLPAKNAPTGWVPVPNWAIEAGLIFLPRGKASVPTTTGEVTARPGDWIERQPDGTLKVIAP